MELHGTRGVDIAAYSSDGLHFWPCGEMFFEGRVCSEDDGVKFCECETCENVRASIDGIMELNEAFLKLPWE